MKYLPSLLTLTLVYLLAGCSNGKLEEKGFQVSNIADDADSPDTLGLNRDSLKIEAKPSNVLLTGISHVRLTTIYKVNVNKRDNSTFIGSNRFHYGYEEADEVSGNNWNNNIIPGLEAVYGYNMVNISYYNISENKQKNFFEKPVLIRTVYYPTFSKDTLNKAPVNRDYFIVTVYNEDSNKDGFINGRDLRRIYLFNIKGERQMALVQENYSVFKSEYDSANDFMYLFAQLDSNNNGRQEEGEPIHIFWVDLKDPVRTGRLY
ncbi:MAG: hypothetical protein IPN36_07020 [Bacteroidetes bacterium]|nr:hypothetical protein [Bacteroidota bacterium]